MARLGLFGSAGACWIPLHTTPWLGVAASVMLLAAFVAAVVSHRRLKAHREVGDRLLLMIDESLQRCTDWLPVIRQADRPIDPNDSAARVGTVLDSGRTWALTEQECDDLDLYALPVGLFGVLNRTSTDIGGRRLRDWLENPALEREIIEQRQNTIQWLETHPEPRLQLMAAAATLRKQNVMVAGLVTAIRAASPLPRPKMVLGLRLWAWPSLLLTLWALAELAQGHLQYSLLLLALLLINGPLYWSMRSSLNRCLTPWQGISPAGRGYEHVAQESSQTLPNRGELGSIRVVLESVAVSSVLPALCRRMTWSESGGMMHTLCNLVFFYDVHVARMILRTVLPHRDSLLTGLGAVADLEALCSMACFAFESSAGGRTCYPSISDEGGVKIRAGRHPLIMPDEVVANDVDVVPDARLWVITGPNMAGKSTLLRMVGVNCLLGQLGTAVAAEAMTMMPVRLITDLSVRDNLARHESYFLAEVRHLKRMVEPTDDPAPILGLIDEPFRGTNSEEQVAASLAVVDHLTRLVNLTLLATHEDRLTLLAEQLPTARNHHFHEQLGEQGMMFDYRLRPGPATARNALDVLARERFPTELIEDARRRLAGDGDED
ncbi:MAG: MutS family DNA mismatch repair protein [Planctomycetes bacterium]|nr:MutS family DNA mismatch repair protein [Planctomycetota bacterium]